MNFAFHSIAKGLKLHRQWIVACTLSITGSVLHASHLTDYHQYDIAEGPLAAALTQFANQTGIYLSSTSDLLIGKSTQGYQGAVSGIEALNTLLEGFTPLAWNPNYTIMIPHLADEMNAQFKQVLRGEKQGIYSLRSDIR